MEKVKENCSSLPQHELLGQSLYNFICPEDYDELQRGITPEEPQPSTSSAIARIQDDNSSSSDDPTSPRSERKFIEQRRSFNIRMSQKALNKRDHGQYECLHVSGLLRLADVCLNQGAGNGGRARHRGRSKVSPFDFALLSTSFEKNDSISKKIFTDYAQRQI